MSLVGKSNPNPPSRVKVPQYVGTAQSWDSLSELSWLEEGGWDNCAQIIFAAWLQRKS